MSYETEILEKYLEVIRKITWSSKAKLQMVKMIREQDSPMAGLKIFKAWEELRTTFFGAPENKVEEISFLQKKLRFFGLRYPQPGMEIQKILKKYYK